jgi:hypothetical protein
MDGDPPGFPEYDSAAACAKLSGWGAATVRICTRNEGEARDAAIYLWPALSSDLQTHCVVVAQLTVPAHLRYGSLHSCLSTMAAGQRDLGGEIPLKTRKEWLDGDIRALKVGHY